jgi:3-demethoxyubiquinol 3-hydroxylase
MIDALIVEFDKALRTVFAQARTLRPIPGQDVPEALMSAQERAHVAGLMRINHCGEICAQALYQGQALMSKDEGIKAALRKASWEETEHLAWTESRLADLGSRKSLLNPLWYAGSFGIGVVAGGLGDRWNLGFLAETERQVEAHLTDHLNQLPPQDEKSRHILHQMKTDEIAHAQLALRLGGRELPAPIKMAMKISSKVMTKTAYWV